MGRHGGYGATGKERERGIDAAAGQEKRLFSPADGQVLGACRERTQIQSCIHCNDG